MLTACHSRKLVCNTRLTRADGTHDLARAVVLAAGVVDELPAVASLADRWGRDVLHCPYCHGWEVRDRAVAVLGTATFVLAPDYVLWTSPPVFAAPVAPPPWS